MPGKLFRRMPPEKLEKEARLEGKLKGKLKDARKMKEKSYSVEDIMNITELSREELQKAGI